jgi:uncharacterized protein (DUF362 family)
MTPVSLVRCASYDLDVVCAALDRSLELLGGLERFVPRGATVLLKPNLVSGQPPRKAATTHPAVLEALLMRLSDLGAKPRLGDSPAFNTAAAVAEKAGLTEVARRYGVPVVELTSPVPVPSPRPKILKRFMVDREVHEADAVINLPKLKSHRQLGFTGCVKNLYGCMPGKRKAYYHFARGNHDMDFARLIAAFAYTVAPELNIVDGVVAMERDGPVGGDPRQVGVLAVGQDPAAVDAVLERVLQAPPQDSLTLNACRELGLGTPHLDKIDLRGEAAADLAVPDFRHAMLIGVRFSPGRLVRSVWRNFLITRLNYDPR